MTCIVGLVENGEVWISGDSLVSSGGRTDVRNDEKVFIKDDMAFGVTGSIRISQIIRYQLSIPRYHEGDDLMAYMVNDFAEAVRSCLKHYGAAQIVNNEDMGGAFMVGFRGRLFVVYSDFQVAEFRERFTAIGSGEEYALGALYALDSSRSELSPEARLQLAISAAIKFNAYVGPPIKTVVV